MESAALEPQVVPAVQSEGDKEVVKECVEVAENGGGAAWHPLKLRISSYNMKKIKYAFLLKALQGWTDVSFVLDKHPRRNFAFVQFRCPADTDRFFTDVDGKALGSVAFKLSRCDRAQEHVESNAKKPRVEQNGTVYPVQGCTRASLSAETALPCLMDIRQRRLGNFGHFTLDQKITPLMEFSYPSQLVMKEQFARSCIRGLTRKAFQSLCPERCNFASRCKRPRCETPAVMQTTAEQSSNGMLPWCSPEVSKGFQGCPIDPIIASPRVLGYRNKCEFTIGHSSECSSLETIEVGFVHRVVNYNPIVASCSGTLSVPLCMQEVCHNIKMLIKRSFAPPEPSVYCRRSDTGLWRLVMVRASHETNSLMVVVQLRTLDDVVQRTAAGLSVDACRQKIAKSLIEELVYADSTHARHRVYDGYTVTSLFLQERTSSSDAFEPEGFQLVFGSPHITQQLLGLSFRVAPASFFQTNTETCALLYTKAFELLNANKESLILDICSGAGTITLCLHRYLREKRCNARLIGVEMVEAAVQDARASAQLNGVTEEDVEFVCARAENALPHILSTIDSKASVTAIVDPPRGGLHPTVLSSLLGCHNIHRIVYISCNPDSLINDAVKLCIPTLLAPYPFQPIRAVPVDMFPHTYHCEMILVLERIPSGGSGE